MTKHLYFYALLALFTVLMFGNAQSLPLWELQGEAKNIRVLGSVHFLREQDYPLPGQIQQAYDAADVLIMELDLDDIDPLEMQAIVQDLAIDSRGRDLASLMGPKDFQKAKRGINQLAIAIEPLAAYEPWFVALQVTQIKLAESELKHGLGIEAWFVTQASKDGKPLHGLETLRDQLGALDSLPGKAQRKFLLQTIDEARDMEVGVNALINAWRQGDVVTLERELLLSVEQQPELYERILRRRNRNWVKSIRQFAGDGQDYLVVVGALHLIGEDSVLQMLADYGIEHRQVFE